MKRARGRVHERRGRAHDRIFEVLLMKELGRGSGRRDVASGALLGADAPLRSGRSLDG